MSVSETYRNRAAQRLAALANTLKAPAVSSSDLNSPVSPFPVENSTLPFWRTEPHEIDNHRTTVELPEKCEVLIIGAGFSGASIAYHLLGDDPSPPSIVVLEARSACSGATGRNGKRASCVQPANHSSLLRRAPETRCILQSPQIHPHVWPGSCCFHCDL